MEVVEKTKVESIGNSIRIVKKSDVRPYHVELRPLKGGTWNIHEVGIGKDSTFNTLSKAKEFYNYMKNYTPTYTSSPIEDAQRKIAEIKGEKE